MTAKPKPKPSGAGTALGTAIASGMPIPADLLARLLPTETSK